MELIKFHGFQVAEPQDDALIEALKAFTKYRIPLFFLLIIAILIFTIRSIEYGYI